MKKLLIFLFIILCSYMVTAQNATTDVQEEKISVTDNSKFYSKIVNWYMDNLNYFSLTSLMALESSFIPFPSEVVVPPAAWKAAQGDMNIILVVIFATLGALIGALINYFLSISLGRFIIYKLSDTRLANFFLVDRNKIEKAESYFVKHGNSSTLIGRLIPVIRQYISIPAGLAKMKLLPFMLYTTIGATIWNIILAVIGYFMYSQKSLLDKYYQEICVIFVIIGCLFVLYLLYNGLKKKRNKDTPSRI